MIPENIQKKLEILSERILSEDFIRIISHYDCDGISAAGILAKSLLRTGRAFHITFLTSPDKEKIIEILDEDSKELCLLLDMGSSYLSALKNYENRLIILDHHVPELKEDKEFILNPHFFGIDGTKHCCASTLSFLLSMKIGNNSDLGRFFVCGAIADKQEILGGLNRAALELSSNISIKNTLALDHEKLVDSFYFMTEPFVENLSGDLDNIREFLRRLKIDEEKNTAELTKKEIEKIATTIILKLLRQGVPPRYAQKIIRKTLFYREENLNVLSEYIDFTGKYERMGLALLYILKNSQDIYDEMKEIHKKYKENLLRELLKIKTHSKRVGRIVYYYVDAPGLTSSTATIAARYIYPNNVLVAVYDDGKYSKLSLRKLDEKINLGEISKNIAEKYGGYGGGHTVAAGAFIPSSMLENFLRDLDASI